MKIQDIVIKEKCIVLGIFDTKTFQTIDRLPNVKNFGVFDSLPVEEYKAVYIYGLLKVVERACEWAEQIIFVIDDVRFPINIQWSVTCSELALVCQNDTYFNKCVFVKGENVIEFDKNLVLN